VFERSFARSQPRILDDDDEILSFSQTCCSLPVQAPPSIDPHSHTLPSSLSQSSCRNRLHGRSVCTRLETRLGTSTAHFHYSCDDQTQTALATDSVTFRSIIGAYQRYAQPSLNSTSSMNRSTLSVVVTERFPYRVTHRRRFPPKKPENITFGVLLTTTDFSRPIKLWFAQRFANTNFAKRQ